MSAKETVTLPIEIDIFTTTKMSPVLGLYSELDQTGLLLDKTLTISTQNETYSYNTFTGNLEVSLKDGTLITDWQSGITELIQFERLNPVYYPLIRTGTFSLSSSIRNLYSDFSYTSYVSPLNNVDNKNTFSLPEDYKSNTVSAYKFRRNRKLLPIIVKQPELVSEFSENEYKNEYIISDNILYFDKDYTTKHGYDSEPLDYDTISNDYILAGNGTGAARDFYLEYFPIIPDTLKAFILYADGTYEEWEFVDNFNFSFATDKHLVLNSDIGIISSGGYQYDSLVSKEEVGSADTEIPFYTTRDIDDYPTIGIIKIEDEYIAYTSRSQNKFLNCFRGYLGTTATSHVIGSVINFEQRGAPISEEASLYVFYESTLRIDCEITSHIFRQGEVNCKPSKHSSASKIVQISSKLRDLDYLVLESDKPRLGQNVYSPLYFGNDISKLTVTAYDSHDEVVEDLPITIEILDPIVGLLDGESTFITKYSNSEGKIFAYYNTPVEMDDYSIKFSSVTYEDTKTLFSLSSISKYIALTDIYLFQLFKQDPSLGSSGLKYSVTAIDNSPTRPGADIEITINGKVDDRYKDGIAYMVSSSAYFATRPIFQSHNDKIYLTGLPVSFVPQYIYLVTSEDVEWSAETLNGIPVLVYTWDTEAEHPLTGDSGAFIPIKPEEVREDGTVVYDYTLPEPDPNRRSSNLGGYLIASPIQISLRAYATDPYTGERIYSNTIYLITKFPNYLVGVDYSGALPVPKGFNFIVDEENVGNGLGVPNFITMNLRGGIYGLQLRFDS